MALEHGVEGPELKRLKAGVYDVLLHTSPNCYQETRFELIDPDPITLDLPVIDTVQYCQGEIVTIQMPDAGLTYTWYHEEKTLSIGNRIDLVQEGKYELLARDTNGCEANQTV